MEAGNSIHPPQKRDKQKVPRSPCRQLTVTIVFPCITEGVRIKAYLLGHVEKLKFFDHDVMGTEKLPEFSKKVYL
jgi:hypothetical protein